MNRATPIVIGLSALVGFFVLAAGNIRSTSATSDETTHLAAGWAALEIGHFHLNPEHPPLMKLAAALPVAGRVWPRGGINDGSAAFARLREQWEAAKTVTWAQWIFAHQLLYGLHDAAGDPPTIERVPRSAFLNEPDALVVRARTVLLLLNGIGLALIIFCWAYELWGRAGAVLPLVLFSFDPNFIAHSGLITTDAGVTLFIAGAVYFFWRCTRRFSWGNVLMFAACVALAQVTKFSALLLVPIVAAFSVVAVRRSALSIAKLAILASATAVAAVVVIWGVYRFRFAATDRPLPIAEAVREVPDSMGIGRALAFAARHRVLPEGYLLGFARARAGTANRAAYLFGEGSADGFRTYYLWTFLLKTPLPTLFAIGAALVFIAMRRPEGAVWPLLAAAIYAAAAVASNLNIGHRHLLPVYPLLYVCCGVLPRRFLITGAATAVSALVVFTPADPMWGRHLSYFNELAGGPRRGWRSLADSNIDWGQDLPRLARLLRERGIDEPIDFVYFGSADPRYYGIRYRNLNQSYYAAPGVPAESTSSAYWLAMSVTHYAGAALGPPTAHYWREYVRKIGAEEAGRAGYSILLFRVPAAAEKYPTGGAV